VKLISATDPTENATKAITFTFNVTDHDGVGDIVGSSAQAHFNFTGETTRSNSSCIGINNYTTLNISEFECTITMQFYDTPGNWTINASIRDSTGLYTENQSVTWKYNQLHAMDLNENTINWSSIGIGSTNTAADNNPIRVINTGNAENLTINVTSYNLVGITDDTHTIFADNFSVGIAADGCSATAMSNATTLQVSSAEVDRGEEAAGREDLYFCLEGVPQTIISQNYSSPYGGWTMRTIVP